MHAGFFWHRRGESESIKLRAVKCVDGRKVITATFEKLGKRACPVMFPIRVLFVLFKKKTTKKKSAAHLTVFSALTEMNKDRMSQIHIKTYIMGERLGS